MANICKLVENVQLAKMESSEKERQELSLIAHNANNVVVI